MTASILPLPVCADALCRKLYDLEAAMTRAIAAQDHASKRRIAAMRDDTLAKIHALGISTEAAFRRGAGGKP